MSQLQSASLSADFCILFLSVASQRLTPHFLYHLLTPFGSVRRRAECRCGSDNATNRQQPYDLIPVPRRCNHLWRVPVYRCLGKEVKLQTTPAPIIHLKFNWQTLRSNFRCRLRTPTSSQSSLHGTRELNPCSTSPGLLASGQPPAFISIHRHLITLYRLCLPVSQQSGWPGAIIGTACA